jgi:GTP-binding protein HflX
MKEFIISEAQTEKAVLVGLITPNQNEQKIKEYLDELAFLADTAGVEPVKMFYQRLDYANPVTFVGTGKLQEIKEYVVENEIGVVIFDDELSPKQLRNIEKELKVMILDRTSLILDIFAKRAQTAHAKTQVELAQYKYMLPRLTRLWTHLERQRGGVGMRGPGETQLETDKRIILDKISLLKKELVSIDKTKSIQRKNRGKMVRVALVGYTNVGKSTLMNLLSKSEVFAENKLFATLDTTVRKVIIDNLPFLLSDTVGFIRKLPTELVESFKSTLDEVREADLLIHIVDVSHPQFEEQIEVVNKTLADIHKEEKPMIIVFNKIDAFSFVPKEEDDLTPRTRENVSLDELKNTWMNRLQDNCIFISAKDKTNVDELKTKLYSRVTGYKVDGLAANGLIHLINSGSAALDGSGQQSIDGQPAMKPFWDITEEEVAKTLDATTWYPADCGYFRGGGFSSQFVTKGGMPVTMSRINLIKGLGPVLQIAEGWTAELPKEVHDTLDVRTNRTWPTTWFAPRLTGEGNFADVYSVMNNWGANHGAFSYGHIGADLITLASVLRIPVCMHNVPEEKIFRPSAWAAFGMDKEGSDYRACQTYGPMYK